MVVMLAVVIIVFLSDKRIRSENRMKKKWWNLPSPGRSRNSCLRDEWGTLCRGTWGQGAGAGIDCSSKIGITGEFYVWCNLSQDSTVFSKNWFGPTPRPSNYNRKDFCIACSCRSLLRNLLHGLPWQFILRWGWTKIRSNMGQLPIEPALLKLDFFCSPRLWWISPIASWCHMVLLNLWSHFHVLLCVMGFWSVFIVTGEHCLSIAQVWPHLLRGLWRWLAGRVRCLKKPKTTKSWIDCDLRHALPTILHARKDCTHQRSPL